MKQHYWSDTETNKKGESLEYCLKKYGMGGYYSLEHDKATALVYFDESHSAKSSWLLAVWILSIGQQGNVRLLEEDPDTYIVTGPPCLDTTFYNEDA